jgi:hypothetical protein
MVIKMAKTKRTPSTKTASSAERVDSMPRAISVTRFPEEIHDERHLSQRATKGREGLVAGDRENGS